MKNKTLRFEPEPKPEDSRVISRRQFARTVTLAATTAALSPSVLAQQTKPPAEPTTATPVKPPEPQGQAPKLSEAAKKEVELKIQWIMDRYGAKLSEAQKTEIRKLVAQTQEPLETLRAFNVENWDEPATVLHFNDAPAQGGRR